MAAGRIVLPPYMPTRNRDGLLVDQARLTVYENETTVKATIYSDDGLTTPQANPVIANSSGQFPPIWAEAGTTGSPVLYSLAIADASGASVGNPGVFDNWQPSVDGETAASALAEAAADSAAASAIDAAASATVAEDALDEILAAAAASPETLPLLNKANLNGGNIASTGNAANFRQNIGAVGSTALAAGTGGALVGFAQTATGAVASTVSAKLDELPLSPEEFGAVGDGVTDDGPAFQALLKAYPSRAGFDVKCRSATYRIATGALYLTRAIRFFGADRYGTKLDFSDNTDVVNAPYNAHIITVHSNNIAGSSSYANPIVLPVGTVGNYGEGAGFNDMEIECNPAISDGIGVFFNVQAPSSSLIVRNANLHCVVWAGAATELVTRGGTTGPTGLDIGGNANLGCYVSVRGIGAVNGDGLHLAGSDANQIILIFPEGVGCKGWAYNDNTLHGNQYFGGHTTSCLYGSARARPLSPNRSVFYGLYSEGDSGTENPSGSMFEIGERALVIAPSGATPEGLSPYLTPELAGIHSGIPYFQAPFADSRGRAVGAAGAEYGYLASGVLEIRTTDGQIVGFRRSGPTYTALRSGTRDAVLFPNVDIGGNLRAGLPYPADGLCFGVNSLHTSGSAAPVSGTHAVGYTVWNESPAAGGKMGWVCVTAGSPGVFKAFGAIDP